jgi:hypothetical protein
MTFQLPVISYFLSLFCCCSVESSALDLDGEGGRKFLRVMLSLVMHNYPQLVSGALELLFRHFSQRQEVIQAFKQASDQVLHCSLFQGKLDFYYSPCAFESYKMFCSE